MKKDLLKNFRIPLTSQSTIEPEEIFFDSSKIKEFADEEVEVEKLEKPISSLAFLAFEILQVTAIIFIGIFTTSIIMSGDGYSVQAQDNSSRALSVFAERGLIYSSDNEILAQNTIYFDIFIRPPKFPTHELLEEELSRISTDIAQALKRDPDSIYQKFLEAESKKFSEYALLKGLSRADVNKLKNYITSKPYLEIRQSSRRNYPKGDIFSHIIGYTGEISSDIEFLKYGGYDRIGKVGIEAFYNDILHGKPGMLIKNINSKGEVFSQELRREPISGDNITLNINAELQQKTHNILKAHTEALGLTAAVAILINPRNGAVLSLVSLPSFDANLFEQGISEQEFNQLVNNPAKPLFNRAIKGEYPTGSTIKPIIAAAALEEGIVSPDFLIYSSGSIQVPSVYNSDVVYEFKDWKAHGWTDIRKALADSVNVYFYTIGGGYKDQEGLGIRKIKEYLEKFGWGEVLGIDFLGERSGLIPSPKWKKEKKGENWYIGDTYLASIGQGDILATPLQITSATAVFANRGTLFVPQILHKIQETVRDPEIISSNFISAENIQIVREGMRRAVTLGSSKFLASLPYEVAGKTGTAQTGRELNHAWFTGFAPYDNPDVVVTVLLEEGDTSNSAVRVAKEIFEAYFEIYLSP